MTEDYNKPLGEWTVDALFAEMKEFFNDLHNGDEFRVYIFDVIKEVILRAGPPYEVYERFGQLRSLLDQMEDIGETDPEFESLLNQVTKIWEEIKGWYFE